MLSIPVRRLEWVSFKKILKLIDHDYRQLLELLNTNKMLFSNLGTFEKVFFNINSSFLIMDYRYSFREKHMVTSWEKYSCGRFILWIRSSLGRISSGWFLPYQRRAQGLHCQGNRYVICAREADRWRYKTGVDLSNPLPLEESRLGIEITLTRFARYGAT